MRRTSRQPPKKVVVESRSSPPAEARFRRLNRYRVEREWQRYEGTAQRDLFRSLRLRFLARHAPSVDGPVLEVGPGPGRFSLELRAWGRPLLLLDLSRSMLERARETVGPAPPTGPPVGFLQGNGRTPPFRPGTFAQVILLGNLVGFASTHAEELLGHSAELVRPGGQLLLETSPSAGESSRYLRRLPATATRRLLRSPLRAVAPRVLREGFLPAEPAKKSEQRFRRLGAEEAEGWLSRASLAVEETLSVAPCLGAAPAALEIVREDAFAWEALLALEEEIGRRADRWRSAATLLVVAKKP